MGEEEEDSWQKSASAALLRRTFSEVRDLSDRPEFFRSIFERQQKFGDFIRSFSTIRMFGRVRPRAHIASSLGDGVPRGSLVQRGASPSSEIILKVVRMPREKKK